jgi:hypothetical protein
VTDEHNVRDILAESGGHGDRAMDRGFEAEEELLDMPGTECREFVHVGGPRDEMKIVLGDGVFERRPLVQAIAKIIVQTMHHDPRPSMQVPNGLLSKEQSFVDPDHVCLRFPRRDDDRRVPAVHMRSMLQAKLGLLERPPPRCLVEVRTLIKIGALKAKGPEGLESPSAVPYELAREEYGLEAIPAHETPCFSLGSMHPCLSLSIQAGQFQLMSSCQGGFVG